MILAAVLAAAMAAQAPPTTPAAPPTGHAPQITVTGSTPDDDAAEAAKTVTQIQDMYDQGCAAREYGAYDDMCNQLNDQLKIAKRDAARKAKAAERAKGAAPR